MTRLFIDTHSELVMMAIVDEKRVYKKEAISNRSHSEVAIPLLDELLKSSGIGLAEIDEIIVVNGPGSFTGVRIGVTIAKTIAYSNNIDIKTITSLEMYGVSAKEYFDIVMVPDSKGVYSAHLVDGKYVEFMYQRQADFDEYISKNGFTILEGKNVDFEKIIAYSKGLKKVNPHKVNPIYIKEIDALK